MLKRRRQSFRLLLNVLSLVFLCDMPGTLSPWTMRFSRTTSTNLCKITPLAFTRCVLLLCCVAYCSCSPCNAVVLCGWVCGLLICFGDWGFCHWNVEFCVMASTAVLLQFYTLWGFWLCSLGYHKRASLMWFLGCMGLLLLYSYMVNSCFGWCF